jgi:hypothetical protein
VLANETIFGCWRVHHAAPFSANMFDRFRIKETSSVTHLWHEALDWDLAPFFFELLFFI